MLIVWIYRCNSFKFSWWAPKDAPHTCFETARNGPSRSSKVVDFCTSRKRVCDFLLIINSNLGPILPRFRDITGFLLRTTSPLFHPNFRVVLIGLDYRCCGSEPRSEDPKLTIRVISFELVQPICPRYINVTDRQTDGRLPIAIPR